MTILIGWRYKLFIGGIVGVIGLALYPIIVHPILHTEDYKKIQEKNRKGIRQEDIQPGNMKVWSNPFEKKQS